MIPGGGGAGSVRHVWGRMRGNVPQQVVENEEAREHGNRPLGRSPALRGNEDDNKWGRRRPRKGRKRRGGKSRRRSGKRRRRRSGTGGKSLQNPRTDEVRNTTLNLYHRSHEEERRFLFFLERK